MAASPEGLSLQKSTVDEALRESEERFRSAFETAMTGFTIVELDNRIRAVNRPLCEMLGYTEAELLERTLPALTHPDDVEFSLDVREKLLSGQMETSRYEQRYIHKDGQIVWAYVTGAVVRDAAGRPACLVAHIIDLSERKKAEQDLARSTVELRESEARFRGAFESATSGFCLTELDGRIRDANRSMCEILGYSLEEMLTLGFYDISHPDDAELTEGPRADMIAGRRDSFRVEKRYLRRNGSTLWADVSGALVRVPGRAPYFVIQLTDITPRKNAEEALARRTADLERSNAELQSFAYVASHDLQQPLRAVASYVHLFGERYQHLLDDRSESWMRHIRFGVERMQQLINDLLRLSQLHTAGNGRVPTDTNGIAKRVWSVLGEQYGVDATADVRDLPIVHADKRQIEQLFQNLLDNSFKYRREDIPLLVRITAERSAEESTRPVWQLAVQDNGIGFEMKYADRIFEMFTRLHSADDYSGTGMGLSICRRIVERHGGRIWAQSVPGRGSTFFFTLADEPE